MKPSALVYLSRTLFTAAFFVVCSVRSATLTGDFSPLASTNVNLTTLGILDWAHWGLNDSNSYNHKSFVTSQISNFTKVGGAAVQRTTTNFVGSTWTDGTPTSTSSNTTTAVFTLGLTNGFQITVPADTTLKKLRLYVGANFAQGQISANLSDASAPNYLNSTLSSETGNSNGIYTINFAAASAGRTLTVTYTAANVYDVTLGGISLQAATLAVNSPALVAISSPSTGSVFFATQDILIDASASDVDGNVASVQFFANGNPLGTVTTPPFTFLWTNVLAGNYSLTASATDNDGSLGTSAPIPIVVSTNLPPTVSIISPTNEMPFLAPANVSISVAASDPNGTVAKVEFFEGENKIGEKVGAPFLFAWTNVLSGEYSIRAKATDNGGATTFSLPVTIFVTATGGVLNGNVSSSSGQSINLSAEGISDWVQWGYFTDRSFNHKVGVASQISDVSFVGFGPNYRFDDNTDQYSWSDGTPIVNATNTPTGIYIVGTGNGFEVTVPASTNLQTLKIYAGAYGARGKFRAFLSDYTAPFYTDTSINNFGNGDNGIYTLQFASAFPNQTLVVQFTVAEMYDLSTGNVTLQAVTLNSGNAPPTVSLTSPTNNTVAVFPATILLSASASDPDGTISKVEFFQGTTKIGESTNSPYNFIWTNVPAGNYSIKARATDNKGATFTSGLVNAFVTIPGGFLSAYSATPPSPVNLTIEGKLDWIHWGLLNRTNVNRKTNVTALISTYSLIGPTRGERYFDNPNTYAWSDGAPTASVVGSATGLYITGLGNGFQFTLPADTTLRRVKVYVGVFRAQGRFEATLNDFSAPSYIDTSTMNNAGASAVYTINYAAASAGKKLTIKYTSFALNDETDGNVTLQAAALSSPIPILQISSAPPSFLNLQFVTEPNLSYTVQYTDALSPTNWQSLSNILGNGASAQIQDGNPLQPKRFYRVKLTP